MSKTFTVISLIALGLGASLAAFPAEDKPQPAPMLHFRFNGNAKNEVKDGAQFELKNTAFRYDALYLNGKYGFRVDQGTYLAVCKTPKLTYTAFTVAVRFKAEEFAPYKTNILTGGTSGRWFGMNRANSGNLTITLNNQALAHEIRNAPLEAGKWTAVACGVDLTTRKVVAYLNGKKVDDFELPKDFKLNVIGSEFEERDKEWSFTNNSNGHIFHGLVDELIIHNRLLTDDEFSMIPLKLGAPSAEDKPQPAPMVHFRFDGNAKNEVKDSAQFELKNTEFRDDALYLNGKYEFNGRQDGYRAVCKTPKLSYAAFTVALRFKAEQFTEIKPFNALRKDNIFVAGTSGRWFGMNRADSGNLTITLNNQAFTHEIMDAPLEAGKWTVVACGVDLPGQRIVAYLNGKNVDDFELPKDFKLEVIGSEFEERDKNWSFTNLGNGNVFHGLVDELIIHNRLLTHYEFSKIPLKP